MSKNDAVDAVLALAGQDTVGRTSGSTGRKAALEALADRHGLDVDRRLPKPELAEAICESVGIEWLPEFDSRGTPSEGGGNISRTGWHWLVEAGRHLAQVESDNLGTSTSAVESELTATVDPRHAGDQQGRTADSRRRTAIEHRAVAVATGYYESQEYAVEDVGAVEPFDLRCTRGDEEVHVEVKGTTGGGTDVHLTANEVTHARCCPNVDLVVVSGIRIDDGVASVEATGGRMQRWADWRIHQGELTATTYRYAVPQLDMHTGDGGP